MANEPEDFSPELRALFEAYPQPSGDADFDARFWRELDARRNRYRGFGGVLRRLIEVEIEGIAVWRLGFSLFGGAATCALGVALLSLSASPTPTASPAPRVAETEMPTAMPRYARELWDDHNWQRPARDLPDLPAPRAPKSPAKEEFSCVSSARGLA